MSFRGTLPFSRGGLASTSSCPSSALVPRLRHTPVQARCTAGVPHPALRMQAVQTSLMGAPRRQWLQRKSRGAAVKVFAVFEKFSERAIRAVMLAQTNAKLLGAPQVSTEHILLGLVAEDTDSKHGYLSSGLTVERAKLAVERLSGRQKAITTSENIPFSQDVRRTFQTATDECKRSQLTYISPEHILMAMLNVPDSTCRLVLQNLAVDIDALKAEAQKRAKGELAAAEPPKKKRSTKTGPSALDEFCRDLCADARRGKIDPVIGREREVARVTQILARRTKNNPILLGDPGVGKTAIAEGLAYSIVHGCNMDGAPLPKFLRNKRVLQLDVGLVMAGAKERGELESRVTRLIAEAKEDKNVILMIDEVHTLVGAGSAGSRGSSGGGGGSGLDMSNLLKPALARGELQCIAATTLDEHRKYIERDTALERRFQPVYVLEPTELDTLDILKGLADRYERHHKCVYTEEALEAAVHLTEKYIQDRVLPDKAIDVMDEAGSRARIAAYMARKGQGRVGPKGEHPKMGEYLQVLEAKGEAVEGQLFEEAHILHRREAEYRAELCGQPSEGTSLPVVDVDAIQAVVSAWSGIPLERMTQQEEAKLLNLSTSLKQRLVGQDDAVDAVAAALCRARSGLKDPNRPIASLLFVGPTGVGKTELTKVLAEQYFGTSDALIRLDMSEYMERHSVSKLVGAPPGYVGYGSGGKLTEAVRRRPNSIVLFDEVEKAHPDVISILLQVMEDGRLTDSGGRVVSFKNSMIILTSNLGSRAIASSGAPARAVFGRANSGGGDNDAPSAGGQERLRSLVLQEVKTFFRPELLNRFDEQVVFQRLGRSEVRTIAALMLRETAARVAAKGVTLEVTPVMMDAIVADGYSTEYGVRPLRQLLVHFIDDVLSEALLNGHVLPGGTAVVDMGRDGRPYVRIPLDGGVLDIPDSFETGPEVDSDADGDDDGGLAELDERLCVSASARATA